jgi:hypothetical protein
MPGELLHENATVLCTHGGQARPTVTDQRVKVGGQKIVTQPPPYQIAGCPLPPQGGGPCATASWVSAATRIKASGQPVLLKDSTAVCAPTGTGVNIILTQMRVKGT